MNIDGRRAQDKVVQEVSRAEALTEAGQTITNERAKVLALCAIANAILALTNAIDGKTT